MSGVKSVYRFLTRWPLTALAVLVVFAVSAPQAGAAGGMPPDWCASLVEKLSDKDLSRMSKVAQSVRFHIPAIEKALFHPIVIEELYEEDNIEVLEPEYILECPVCRGASREMLKAIYQSQDPIVPELEYVITPRGQGLPGVNQPMRHVFLMAPGFFSNGMPLYVDPSIRQFFVYVLDREELENLVPKVFVGSPIHLFNLMSKLEQIHGVPAGRFFGSYVSAHGLDKEGK